MAVLLLIAGCSKTAQEQQQTTNAEIRVDLLFEHDGCRVYRFFDDGHRYFARCQTGSGHVQSSRTVTTIVGKTIITHTYPDAVAQDHVR